jgi:hypothetical protein
MVLFIWLLNYQYFKEEIYMQGMIENIKMMVD